MIEEAQLAATNIRWSCSLSPVGNVICDLSGIIATHSTELAGAFYSRRTARKLNVALTELINNVLENFSDDDSPIMVEWELKDGYLSTKVAADATREQFERVKQVVDHVNSAESPKALLRDTIKERRKARLKGGLGLMRLVAENNFEVRVEFDQPLMSVETRIALGGLE